MPEPEPVCLAPNDHVVPFNVASLRPFVVLSTYAVSLYALRLFSEYPPASVLPFPYTLLFSQRLWKSAASTATGTYLIPFNSVFTYFVVSSPILSVVSLVSLLVFFVNVLPSARTALFASVHFATLYSFPFSPSI